MRAFRVRVSAINITGISPEPADFPGTPHVRERVLRESDVVVISLPPTTPRGGSSARKNWPG